MLTAAKPGEGYRANAVPTSVCDGNGLDAANGYVPWQQQLLEFTGQLKRASAPTAGVSATTPATVDHCLVPTPGQS